jgi:hypothetical protein
MRRFDSSIDAVTQRVTAATAQTRTPSRLPAGQPRQKVRSKQWPDAEGKRGGGERADLAKSAKTPLLGGAKNASPDCKGKRSLRGKRSDPLHGANGRPKVGAVPAVVVRTRIGLCRRVSTTSGVSLPAGNGRTGRKGLTQKFPAGDSRDGPAMRPKHPHAAESGVGEHPARESESA